MKINGLHNLRYSVTDLHNGGNLHQLIPSAWNGQFKLTMSITYANLIKVHTNQLLKSSASTQVIRNHGTALRAWTRSLNLAEYSYIGAEFSIEGFEGFLKAHINATELSERSKADRRGLLRAWHATHQTLHRGTPPQPNRRERSQALTETSIGVFESALKEALFEAGLTPKRAAKLAGISPSALGRWSRGAVPNARSERSIFLLERTLDLPEGTLQAAWKKALASEAPAYIDAHRLRQRDAQRSPYRLSQDKVTEALKNQWYQVLDYKTCLRPRDMARSPGARWTLVAPKDGMTKTSVFTRVGKLVSPSADIAWSHTSLYLGFLALPISDGGFGVDPKIAQTLAWLAVPHAIEAYLNFVSQRSGGLSHSGHRTFCSMVASFTHPSYGYLAQRPELYATLPSEATDGREWLELCAKARETANLFKVSAVEKSRDPAVSIQFFLDHPAPLMPVMQAIEKLGQIARLAPSGSREQLVAKRDRVLLALLIANPLRLKHWVTLTCMPSSAGNIYRTPQGSWRIQIPGRQFKNRKRVASQGYSVKIPERLSPLIDDYMTNVRPFLLGSRRDSGEFFLASTGKRFDGLAKQVFKVTRKLMPGCGGISPHAFRHLVATDWLMRFPNDFLTVAELLNDSLAVVMQSYAHLKKDTAFTRYEAYISELLDAKMSTVTYG